MKAKIMRPSLMTGLFVSVLFSVIVPVAMAYEPLAYPWKSWGEISESEYGLKIDGYAEQGVDWTRSCLCRRG